MARKRIYFLSFLFILCGFVLSATAQEKFNAEQYIKDNKGSRILIYGDTRTNYKVHEQIVKQMLKCRPNAVFHTGDLVENGKNIKLWKRFDKIVKLLANTAKYYPVPGNHERESPNYYNRFGHFKAPVKWYKVDIDNIRFICLNSNLPLREGSQEYAWLKYTLEHNNKKYIIVTMHHPLLTTGQHPPFIKNNLIPLFEKYHVSAVYAGHNHNYERCEKNSIAYITTGGGGAPLYHPKKYVSEKMKSYSKKFVSAYHYCVLLKTDDGIYSIAVGLDNKVIDKFKLIPSK